MASGTDCPACGQFISLRAMLRQARKQTGTCPHCGARIRYPKNTVYRLAMFFAGVATGAFAGSRLIPSASRGDWFTFAMVLSTLVMAAVVLIAGFTWYSRSYRALELVPAD